LSAYYSEIPDIYYDFAALHRNKFRDDVQSGEKTVESTDK